MASYFLKRQSQVHGPLVGDNLLELARSGKVHPTDQISASKEGPWQSAGSVSALKAIFEKAVQQPVGESPDSPETPPAPAETGQWFVNITEFAGDRIEGPVSEQRIKDLIDEKQVNAKAQVMHPVETDNEWVLLRSTDLMQHIEQRKEEKRERKVEVKAEREQARQEAKGNLEEAQDKRLAELKSEFENTSRDIGKWVVNVQTDPIDDRKQMFLTLFADSGTDTVGNRVSLQIIISEDINVKVGINWGDSSVFILDLEKGFLDSVPTLKEVVSRVGSHPPGSMSWNVTNDRHGTILPSFWSGRGDTPLYDRTNLFQRADTEAIRKRKLFLNRVLKYHCVRSLIDEESAVFKVTPDVQNPITARFDLRGLRHALAADELGLKCLAALPEVADHSWVSGAPSIKASAAQFDYGCSLGCLLFVVPCAMATLIAGLLLLDVIPIDTDERKPLFAALAFGTILTLISSLIYLRLRRGSKLPSG
jgi:hypothetical protein